MQCIHEPAQTSLSCNSKKVCKTVLNFSLNYKMDSRTRVNVMITIVSGFGLFSTKTWTIFNENQCYDQYMV
jgi:hypothetical protein